MSSITFTPSDKWEQVFDKIRQGYIDERGPHPGARTVDGRRLPLTTSVDGLLMLATFAPELTKRLLASARSEGGKLEADGLENAGFLELLGAELGTSDDISFILPGPYLAGVATDPADPTLRTITRASFGLGDLAPGSEASIGEMVLFVMHANAVGSTFRPNFNSSRDFSVAGNLLRAWDALADASTDIIANNRDIQSAGNVISTDECVLIWRNLEVLAIVLDISDGRKAASISEQTIHAINVNAGRALSALPSAHDIADTAGRLSAGIANQLGKFGGTVAAGAAQGFGEGVGVQGAALVALAIWIGVRS